MIHVTVGVPAYNEERNIGKLLSTLLQQRTYSVRIDEIIVVSSGSTDKTDTIVEEFARRGCRVMLIREVGDPRLSLDFLLRLAFNKWYVFALASALVASFLSYVALKEVGVQAGRLFLLLSMVATILACALVLREKLTLKEFIGMAFIMAGIVLIGR